MKNKIPKKLHFIWVGSQPKSELVLQCMESWKKYLPDYEIIEWGNDSLAGITNKYVLDAYSHQKWAFVSDYLRLYALYTQGGIYVDSDVLVTRSFDQFLNHDFFSGYESYNNVTSPITAVMGAVKNNVVIKELLEEYKNLDFVTPEGQLDLQTNTSRITRYFENKFGLKAPYNKDATTELSNNILLYPSTYFCTPEAKRDNFAIHLFNGSWIDGFSRRDKIKIGKYRLVRFKREHLRNNIMPLGVNETLLFSLKISPKKTYGLIKKKRYGF